MVGDRLQQGAFEQKGLRKNVGLLLFQGTPLLLFLHTDLQQLGLVVPLVECRARIESFVTLQADEIRAEDARQDLGDLGLAHACRPFHQQRFAQRASYVKGHGNRRIGDVSLVSELTLAANGFRTRHVWQGMVRVAARARQPIKIE